MKKVKLLHIQLLPLLTGVQNVSLAELSRLDDNKFDKYLVCKEPGALTELCQKINVNTATCKYFVREISFIKDVCAFFWLYMYLRRNDFDVVHTHSSKTGVLGRLAARLAGVPMIVHTVHGFSFPSANNRLQQVIYQLLERLGASCSDIIICLHDADKEICIQSLKVSSDKIKIVPNGVDLYRFHPSPMDEKVKLRAEKSLPKNHILVGMVGRLWPQKNPQLLVDSALDILKTHQDVSFIFVGDGELRGTLEDNVDACFKKHFHFLGWRDDTPEILKCLDIFVLPSLWEGMPLAILEALASGLPCVVSNIPGNHHLVRNGVNGFLFSPDRQDELTEIINSLLVNRDKIGFISNQARESAVGMYDIKSRVRKVDEIYTKFLSYEQK
ncbi:glycosyltransferase family 4 protein [Vibrio coralliirubri]|uniref:glycosyltransferase family 4 protein n=1 Tax=Vibrio coralliirubri TaxID=1516159 RepID=UPI002FE0FB50